MILRSACLIKMQKMRGKSTRIFYISRKFKISVRLLHPVNSNLFFLFLFHKLINRFVQLLDLLHIPRLNRVYETVPDVILQDDLPGIIQS